MARVFYVEDELFLAKIVKESLESRGFKMTHIADGDIAVKVFDKEAFDICVLDVMLPGRDGYEIAAEIRKSADKIPIIFLTAKNQSDDVIQGFASGGNDFIKKPFSMEELILRINNLLKITGHLMVEESKITIGNFLFNPQNMTLINEQEQHILSFKENEILKVLCQNVSQRVDRSDLLLKVWGNDSFFNSRTLDVYIRKLRTIFQSDENIQIITLRGVGYIFYINKV